MPLFDVFLKFLLCDLSQNAFLADHLLSSVFSKRQAKPWPQMKLTKVTQCLHLVRSQWLIIQPRDDDTADFLPPFRRYPAPAPARIPSPSAKHRVALEILEVKRRVAPEKEERDGWIVVLGRIAAPGGVGRLLFHQDGHVDAASDGREAQPAKDDVRRGKFDGFELWPTERLPVALTVDSDPAHSLAVVRLIGQQLVGAVGTQEVDEMWEVSGVEVVALLRVIVGLFHAICDDGASPVIRLCRVD